VHQENKDATEAQPINRRDIHMIKSMSKLCARVCFVLLGMLTSTAYPQLTNGTHLTIGLGSTFTFDGAQPISLLNGNDGLVLGEVAPAPAGSYHLGPLDGNPGESGGIVKSFEFAGNTATFWTETPIIDLGGGLIDMSGWRGAWGPEPLFTFDYPTGLFTVTGDTYVLDYNALIVQPPPFASTPFFLHLEGEVVVPNQSPDCASASASIENIWPPNKNFVSVNILGVTDPDGDAVSITINTILQDEPVDSHGNGQFAPDGAGIGGTTADVRADREGGSVKARGNGRVYHIGFSADDSKEGSCSGEVLVGVPHDQAIAPIDDGALYDSTVP
jgi:hypothetical protein